MKQDKKDDIPATQQRSRWLANFFAKVLYKTVVPLAIVAAGVGFLKYQVDNRPQAERRKPERQARLVTTLTVQKESSTAIVPGMGTVAASREIILTPEITGVITSIDPSVIPGGLVRAGQLLYQVDSRDYQAIVKQRQSELAKAQLEFKLETGNQTVARQEFDLLEDIVLEDDTELVLRKPQLVSARQALQAAQAALEKAKLDVERCSVRAPFNAIIKARHADLGARVSTTTALAELTGTDEYWIEVMVPVSQLSWVDIPRSEDQKGSAARVYNPSAWGEGVYRQGRVIRLLGQLEEKGLLARLLVAVEDPLHLHQADALEPLLIGSYVRVEIVGRLIRDTIALPRAFVRNGNTVWVMNDQNTLEIRPVRIAFSNRETVYITEGIEDNNLVVTTLLSAAVDGMPLRAETLPDHEIQTAGVPVTDETGAGL
jgi:RND family efflux transporter MFP subunit